MKTAVSIPDPVFQSAEVLASRLGLSRSELYARALESFVNTYDPNPVTARLNEVYSTEKAEVRLDVMAAQKALLETEPVIPESMPSPLSAEERWHRLQAFRATRGKYRGLLSSVDEFIARKQEEKELER